MMTFRQWYIISVRRAVGGSGCCGYWEGRGQILRRRELLCRSILGGTLYGSEMWVMSPRIGKTLGGFHHRVVRILTRWNPKKRLDVTWGYPPLTEVILYAGIQEVDTYIARRQNTVTQFIATSPIMDLCVLATRSPGQGCQSGTEGKRAWTWRRNRQRLWQRNCNWRRESEMIRGERQMTNVEGYCSVLIT